MRVPYATDAKLVPLNTRIEDRFPALMRMRRVWVGNGRASERGHCVLLMSSPLPRALLCS